jgi:hypothetical protein
MKVGSALAVVPTVIPGQAPLELDGVPREDGPRRRAATAADRRAAKPDYGLSVVEDCCADRDHERRPGTFRGEGLSRYGQLAIKSRTNPAGPPG